MSKYRLFERRVVWLPTWRGALLGCITLLAIGGFLATRVQAFLSPTEPVGGSVLIVEGWLPTSSLERAMELFAQGHYDRILTTGGPVEHWAGQLGDTTYARLAADFLVARGVPAARVVAVEAPASAQNRTYLSAVMVREWSQRAGLPSRGYDLVSQGPHSRRSLYLYRLALGSHVPIGVFAATAPGYAPDAWWRSSAGAKDVLTELVGLVWVKCCFWPGSFGSHEEKWGRPSVSPIQQPQPSSDPGVGARLDWPPGKGAHEMAATSKFATSVDPTGSPLPPTLDLASASHRG